MNMDRTGQNTFPDVSMITSPPPSYCSSLSTGAAAGCSRHAPLRFGLAYDTIPLPIINLTRRVVSIPLPIINLTRRVVLAYFHIKKSTGEAKEEELRDIIWP